MFTFTPIHLFIHSVIQSIIHSIMSIQFSSMQFNSIPSFVRSFVHSFLHSLVHSFFQLFRNFRPGKCVRRRLNGMARKPRTNLRTGQKWGLLACFGAFLVLTCFGISKKLCGLLMCSIVSWPICCSLGFVSS